MGSPMGRVAFAVAGQKEQTRPLLNHRTGLVAVVGGYCSLVIRN